MAYVIKRYSNRKLYDTQESRYVTLEDPRRLEPAHRELSVQADLASGLRLRGYIDRLDIAPGGSRTLGRPEIDQHEIRERGPDGPARRGERFRQTFALGDDARAEREAPLPLTPAGAEARVALHRLDVLVATVERRLELVERHVFAAAGEGLHGSTRERFSGPASFFGARGPG